MCIRDRVKVEIPHPRNRKSAAFLATIDRVYATLAGQTEAESVELGTAPGEPGRTRGLPAVDINDLAGLLERLDDLPNDCLLYTSPSPRDRTRSRMPSSA